jgi:hypothetical protein
MVIKKEQLFILTFAIFGAFTANLFLSSQGSLISYGWVIILILISPVIYRNLRKKHKKGMLDSTWQIFSNITCLIIILTFIMSVYFALSNMYLRALTA